ncbi:MAG: TetR/AcrR family transcriptional regulator [Burkholderiales bacterium]|nr:TetR/AcrR family transcriptional regulator [Burkholderiales bacterium]
MTQSRTVVSKAPARGPGGSRRGPRRPGKAAAALPGLSRERIVEAALALVADEGMAGLSYRKLGERLHCEAMSLYHHIPSKQHLLDAMVDQAVDSVAEAPAGLSPIERLRHLAHAYREMAHRNATLFPLIALHRLNTPAGVRFIERVLRAVHDVVRDEEKAARHFRAFGYYLMGAGLDETSGYAKGPTAAEPVDDAYIAAHCPHLVAAARFFGRDQWDATFELGVEALLAAMARDAPDAAA